MLGLLLDSVEIFSLFLFIDGWRLSTVILINDFLECL